MTKTNWKVAMSASDLVALDAAATNSQHEKSLFHSENTMK